MTLRQYLTHLYWWLRIIPRWSEHEHTTVGVAGSGEYHCLICGRYCPDDDDEWDATCAECGHELTLVRPGKWQCDYCEAKEYTHDT